MKSQTDSRRTFAYLTVSGSSLSHVDVLTFTLGMVVLVASFILPAVALHFFVTDGDAVQLDFGCGWKRSSENFAER